MNITNIEIEFKKRDEAVDDALKIIKPMLCILSVAGYIDDVDLDMVFDILMKDRHLPPALSIWKEADE